MAEEYGICNPLRGIEAPTGEQITALRLRLQLTQAAAGQLIGCAANEWARYERGARRMSPAAWAVLLLTVGEHPALTVHPRR